MLLEKPGTLQRPLAQEYTHKQVPLPYEEFSANELNEMLATRLITHQQLIIRDIRLQAPNSVVTVGKIETKQKTN